MANTNRRGEIDATAPLRYSARINAALNIAENGIISADRDFLIELRGKVLDENTDYITANFDALRRSGQDIIAEVASLERPLLGIPPADMYQQESLREDYYGVLARAQLLKTRRAVLTVALAEYALGPTEQKRTDLVAEIDSIIGPLIGAVGDVLKMTTEAGSLITRPVLSLVDADIVRDEAAKPDRCRIRFTVKNVGAADAGNAQATLDFLTTAVTATGGNTFDLGTLQQDATVHDSLEVDIASGVTHITLSALLETGGRSFVDRRTLAVPQSTVGIEDSPQLPASCIRIIRIRSIPRPRSASNCLAR